jgi:hypothetical protein
MGFFHDLPRSIPRSQCEAAHAGAAHAGAHAIMPGTRTENPDDCRHPSCGARRGGPGLICALQPCGRSSGKLAAPSHHRPAERSRTQTEPVAPGQMSVILSRWKVGVDPGTVQRISRPSRKASPRKVQAKLICPAHVFHKEKGRRSE